MGFRKQLVPLSRLEGGIAVPAKAGLDAGFHQKDRGPYILISAASTMASAISRMDLRSFMLFC